MGNTVIVEPVREAIRCGQRGMLLVGHDADSGKEHRWWISLADVRNSMRNHEKNKAKRA